jgi:hypothetical protein
LIVRKGNPLLVPKQKCAITQAFLRGFIKDIEAER